MFVRYGVLLCFCIFFVLQILSQELTTCTQEGRFWSTQWRLPLDWIGQDSVWEFESCGHRVHVQGNFLTSQNIKILFPCISSNPKFSVYHVGVGKIYERSLALTSTIAKISIPQIPESSHTWDMKWHYVPQILIWINLGICSIFLRDTKKMFLGMLGSSLGISFAIFLYLASVIPAEHIRFQCILVESSRGIDATSSQSDAVVWYGRSAYVQTYDVYRVWNNTHLEWYHPANAYPLFPIHSLDYYWDIMEQRLRIQNTNGLQELRYIQDSLDIFPGIIEISLHADETTLTIQNNSPYEWKNAVYLANSMMFFLGDIACGACQNFVIDTKHSKSLYAGLESYPSWNMYPTPGRKQLQSPQGIIAQTSTSISDNNLWAKDLQYRVIYFPMPQE